MRGVLGYRNGQYVAETTNTWYGPLGAVIAAQGATVGATGNEVKESFTVDALGNRHHTQQLNIKPVGYPDQNGLRDYTIDGFGRLTEVTSPPATGWYYSKEITYDDAGNVYTTSLDQRDYMSSGTLWDAGINYYDAGDRLRVYNRHIGQLSVSDDSRPGQRGVFEEYFYDALGRRVMTRSRRDAQCPSSVSECASYLERTVWNGDQVIYEQRVPGATSTSVAAMETTNPVGLGSSDYAWGSVGYVHALGIDQPLAVFRTGMQSYPAVVTMYPHANWRGLYELGTQADGTVCRTGSNCVQIAWPGAVATVDMAPGNTSDGPAWFGSLIVGGADGSGMTYMRNRYYDPGTGRFTQQDPIGLGGGMNLYGFAGGDPVNFSDPFGLCTDPKKPECSRTFFLGIGGELIIGGGGGLAAGFSYSSGEGLGVYARQGVAAGLDVNVFLEGGTSTDRTAFDGSAVEACAGVLSVGGCGSTNANGTTFSGSVGTGTDDFPLAVSTHAGASTTQSLTWRDLTEHARHLAQQAVQAVYRAYGVPRS